MATLRFTPMQIPGAQLGGLNCLPDIQNQAYLQAPIRISPRVTPEESRWVNKGMVSTLLPYQFQDRYDRGTDMLSLSSAVLENEHFRATFVTQLGGRLWSLIDKKTGRELLYANNAFRPANLALRNAWFSGGVEWNVGIRGHSPLTCSPLFACACKNTRGEPVLKMYEYERIRGVVYCVRAALREDVLLVNVTVENTRDAETPMYWWSNIAVPETPGVRVIVPASHTFLCAYGKNAYMLDTAALPAPRPESGAAVDITYPQNIARSRDFFFKIPEDRRKFVAAARPDGTGFAQFSTQRLAGRKLFVWGTHAGGRHWSEWLTEGMGPYIEIQAGLLKTQLEHFPMEGRSTISWTEGYTALCADPAILHGSDYQAAGREVERALENRFHLLESDAFDIASEETPACYGSGWGALENRIRETPVSAHAAFPEDSLNDEQAAWLSLLNEGHFPDMRADAPIVSYAVGPFWKDLLSRHLRENWYDYYQLGVMRCANGEYAEARESFSRSVQLTRNAWALRCLARLDRVEKGGPDAAARRMLEAVALAPDYAPLWEECAQALIDNGQYDRWIAMFDTLSDALRENGRLKYALAVCLIRSGNTARARNVLNDRLVICDLREGEYSLSALWIELYGRVLAEETGAPADTLSDEEIYARYPLPRALDFRMNAQKSKE